MKLSGQLFLFIGDSVIFPFLPINFFSNVIYILKLANKFITATAFVVALHLRSQSDFLFGLL